MDGGATEKSSQGNWSSSFGEGPRQVIAARTMGRRRRGRGQKSALTENVNSSHHEEGAQLLTKSRLISSIITFYQRLPQLPTPLIAQIRSI